MLNTFLCAAHTYFFVHAASLCCFASTCTVFSVIHNQYLYYLFAVGKTGNALTFAHDKGGVLTPFTLPPILDASDALASCYKALVKP